MADDMMQGRPTKSGPTPPNMIKNQWSFLPPVVIDTAPFGTVSPCLSTLLAIIGTEAALEAFGVHHTACTSFKDAVCPLA